MFANCPARRWIGNDRTLCDPHRRRQEWALHPVRDLDSDSADLTESVTSIEQQHDVDIARVVRITPGHRPETNAATRSSLRSKSTTASPNPSLARKHLTTKYPSENVRTRGLLDKACRAGGVLPGLIRPDYSIVRNDCGCVDEFMVLSGDDRCQNPAVATRAESIRGKSQSG